jgi:hypothetical protein
MAWKAPSSLMDGPALMGSICMQIIASLTAQTHSASVGRLLHEMLGKAAVKTTVKLPRKVTCVKKEEVIEIIDDRGTQQISQFVGSRVLGCKINQKKTVLVASWDVCNLHSQC